MVFVRTCTAAFRCSTAGTTYVIPLGIDFYTLQLCDKLCKFCRWHQFHHGIDNLKEVGNGLVGVGAGSLHLALHILAQGLCTLAKILAHELCLLNGLLEECPCTYLCEERHMGLEVLLHLDYLV